MPKILFIPQTFSMFKTDEVNIGFPPLPRGLELRSSLPEARDISNTGEAVFRMSL
jgi:hypothetical protein